MMTLQQFQEWFEARFIGVLEEKSKKFTHASNSPAVWDILAYLPQYVSKGKRIRPYMVYVGYANHGGTNDIFPLLACIELLHAFCLIQDDIMDNESVRHEVLTMHRKVAEMYESREIGKSVAMLVGDLLLAWSYECLWEIEAIETYAAPDVTTEFRMLLSEVLHGQLLDIILATEKNPPKNVILKSMYLKSAQYSFFRPLHMGMMLAGATEETREFAEEYAVSLGMGFQLQDDIRDCLDDVREGQPTLISWYMFNVALDTDRNEFDLFFSNEWSSEEEGRLIKVLRDSGALPFAEKTAEDYFLDAEDAIFAHDRSEEDIWQEIVDTVKAL